VSTGNKWNNLLKISVCIATVISVYEEVWGWFSFFVVGKPDQLNIILWTRQLSILLQMIKK